MFTRLKELYLASYQVVERMSIADLMDYLINNNPDAYFMNTRSMGKLYGEEELALFEAAKSDPTLSELYGNVKKDITGDHDALVAKIKEEIIESLELIKEKVAKEDFEEKNQIIFLEHDYSPYFYWCGFGEGEYSLLSEPKYIKYSRKEFYNGIGKIDFSEYCTRINELEEYLEELGILDSVADADPYLQFRSAYRYKLYILLHRAFSEIPLTAFEGIPTKLPLYIYGNEHDCEVMNVYIYD